VNEKETGDNQPFFNDGGIVLNTVSVFAFL
jgi:hypothetical protein